MHSLSITPPETQHVFTNTRGHTVYADTRAPINPKHFSSGVGRFRLVERSWSRSDGFVHRDRGPTFVLTRRAWWVLVLAFCGRWAESRPTALYIETTEKKEEKGGRLVGIRFDKACLVYSFCFSCVSVSVFCWERRRSNAAAPLQ